MPTLGLRSTLPAIVGTTVFVVEDDEAARHSAEALLEAMGYRVRAYGSAEAFLAEVDEQTKGFLLLDYRLDGMTGYQLLDRLRKRQISIPTIIFTGVFDRSITRRARRYDEVVAVLNKPLGGGSLQHALIHAADLQRSRV